MLKILTTLIVLSALVIGGRVLVLRKVRKLQAAPKAKTIGAFVKTALVRKGDMRETRDYFAKIEPWKSSKIASRVIGTIERILVDEGDIVKKGALLAELDHRQVDAKMSAALAQIDQARADLEANQALVASLRKSSDYWELQSRRDAELVSSGSIPSAQAESTHEKMSDFKGRLAAARRKSASLEARIRSARARLDELSVSLTYCSVKSPFDGVVTARLVDPGDLASPGKTLFVLEDRIRRRIVFEVPQRDLPFVRPQTAVEYMVGDKTMKASVTSLHPALNEAGMARAEIDLDTGGGARAPLPLGGYLTVTIVLKTMENVPIVPASAIVETIDNKKDRARVFIVDGRKRLVSKDIRILSIACDDAAVEGVAPGDRVVLNSFLGWVRLSEGRKVEVNF